jgi:phosphoenolpyruvate-protein phosphotransferase (PTS system enzyme I)
VSRRLFGIPASPGIATGPAVVLGRQEIKFSRRRIEDAAVNEEIERFRFAVAVSAAQLAGVASQFGPDDGVGRSIIEAHKLMLKDDTLVGATERTIASQLLNAEWALENAVDRLYKIFDNIDDPYFRERRSDIDFVSQRLLRNLTGKPGRLLTNLDGPSIIVAYDLSPAETAEMLGQPIIGFVTAMGSRTSHTAIMARSLEIPAVVGLGDITDLVNPGGTIVVDGIKGEVVIDPEPSESQEFQRRSIAWFERTRSLLANRDLPAETLDGHRIELLGNIEFPGEAAVALEHGSDGIGLYRTEFLYVNRTGLPTLEEQYTVFRSVVETVAPKPVTLRTFDIGGDKYVSTFMLPEELNPALGLRAVRLGLRLPEIFKTQLKAMMMAAVHGDVRIMFPMVSGVAEARACIALLHEAASELERDGIDHVPRPPIGCMIEVPSAVLTADLLARELDFFSIGTNDLIQYTLAIDRTSEHVAHLYQPLHPAVLRAISQTIRGAHAEGIPVGTCGAMAEEPAHALVLLGLGLDFLSATPLELPRIKHVIRSVEVSIVRDVVQEVLDLSTAEEVEAFVRDAFSLVLDGLSLEDA